MSHSSIKLNHNKCSFLTSQLDSEGKLISVHRSMRSPHQAVGYAEVRPVSDLLYLQLLSMTQGKLKHNTFNQWLSAKLRISKAN